MVGDVFVVQGQRVAVLAQGGAGFGVAEALLGLQEVTVGDQDSRDRVPQGVQANALVCVSADEVAEPVAQRAGAKARVVVSVGGEQPRPELLTR